MQNATSDTQALPDTTVSVRDVFGIDSDMRVPAYSRTEEHVPDTDKPTTSSTATRRSPSWPASRATAAS